MNKVCSVQYLGLVDYQCAWDYQNMLADEVSSGERDNTLLLLEHPHTYTVGRRGGAENLIWSEEELAEKSIDVLWVDRGGDITYHGPGQIVGYPILRLTPIGSAEPGSLRVDYIGYIRRLEQVLIDALAVFEIQAFRIDRKTGVWVTTPGELNPGKIASIGVKVDANGVSRHGFALNVNPDMTYWQGIIPCGLTQVKMINMVQILPGFDQKEAVISALRQNFGLVFRMEMQHQTPNLRQQACLSRYHFN